MGGWWPLGGPGGAHGWCVSVVDYCCFTVFGRCRVLNIEELMMKSLKIVGVDVDSSPGAAESFANGDDAKVIVRFDRPLSSVERKRVKYELAKHVDDVERVSANGSTLTVRTRDFDSVRGFVESANTYLDQWCADVVAEVERAKAVLVDAAESLGSVVVWRKSQV